MPRTPLSTYRLQIHAGFDFRAATAMADYLRDLGITHMYSSPYLQAQAGSMHGYDVVDHHTVNQELGGREEHERLCNRLKELGLGQILDIVPNHMSISGKNKIWLDVLENGPSSRFASFFDIDWNSAEQRLRDKVMLPVLGDQYGRVLSKGELKVGRQGSAFAVQYFENSYPLEPRSTAHLLTRAATIAASDTLNFLAESFRRLPSPDSTDRLSQHARHRDKTVLRGMLDRLCSEEEGVCKAIDETLAEVNGSTDALDDLLNQQNYRLAFWRTSDQELGYRRFFDVNNLVGLRQEREHVFEETHELIFHWLQEGVLDGVRVDHPDGLRDPSQYFERLRKHAPKAYVVAEKILEPGEFLRTTWPVEGTTGYDFMNVCNALLVHPEGIAELESIYRDFTKMPTDFPQIAYEKKSAIERETLASDVNRLANLFVEICENNRDFRDFTRSEIRRAIRAVAACFGVYRTYVVAASDGPDEITDEDRQQIAEAVAEAKIRKPDIDTSLYDFMADILSLRNRGPLESEFIARFQQFTSPVMAKGIEDTAFYTYNRHVGMNEVGGNPSRNGLALADFHSYQETMQATHPITMTALSTHDTKRSDDVRARLAVLAEIPDRFRLAIRRWSRMNHSFRTGRFPDANSEYFLYQTLIGAWPITVERAQEYMTKAMREAKLETAWTAQNADFEDAMHNFIASILQHEPFITDLEAFVARINRAGRINSLSQTLIKYTAPGMPDLYQGSELWDHSLVDPDNRRPVDYDLRRWLLGEIKNLSPSEFTENLESRFEDGSPKLWTIYQALRLRNERPHAFGAEAAYVPCEVAGPRVDNVVAFTRGGEVLSLTQRFPYKTAGAWPVTTLVVPPGRWTNRLTGITVAGGRVRVGNLLDRFPVALLVREP
ncbi:malto-oligosyltrehalose synthase [Terriglobus saanensis]|uniref:Malto-oligosyltrehalose synthase n=1 Tax=Terriglobus saanensis (strain ATCC BAA-1853 / DSM 23119 / SP1PR4) TaxID=401053 RepID=E8UY07_TERSS|nr:malto-oligosyltrehalose synthase [Terriglobus saanensis]ADV84241.1 malto-oligosyltrehalose synthase [Terriglobus saanensis SP1PR4]